MEEENNKGKKCFSKEHEEADATYYCSECKIYICKKCEVIHSKLFQKHNKYNLDVNISDIYTGFCKEENHFDKLEYFCKSHNKLCCCGCIAKLKRKGKGQHTDCDICVIEDIKEEKQNKLKDNLAQLKDFSKDIENSINELKNILEKAT